MKAKNIEQSIWNNMNKEPEILNLIPALLESCSDEFRAIYWDYRSRGLTHEQIISCASESNLTKP